MTEAIGNMSFTSQLSDQIKDAMRARDTVALDALRFLLSKVKNVQIDLGHDLSDQEFISVVQKEVKTRNESIEQFKAAGRAELVDREEQQLAVLKKFLPEQMPAEQVEAEVKKIVDAASSKEFPVVIREVMSQLKGKADGKLLADTTKKLLDQ